MGLHFRNISDDDLAWTRREMTRGNTLADCAAVLGVEAARLDRALWGAIGFEPIGAAVRRLMPYIEAGQPIPDALLQRKGRAA